MTKKTILSLFTVILLSGCVADRESSSSAFSSSNLSLDDSSSFNSTTNNSISSSSSSSIISSISSTSSSSISTDVKNENIILDFYAINDFHGRISEREDENVPGIAKLATYLKDRKKENEDGYVFLNSGDYWQDTYESGYNEGQLLTECFDLMECETMSLGNHEFDWGIETIKENKKLTNYTTFLGCNIYEYPDTSKKSDLVESYKIIERNGIKIGIIGAIGQYQLTSITSSNWENITFLPHTDLVKELSDELRLEKDCDIVILSIHADESDSDPYEITKISPNSNEKYVDAVFCAHTHQREIKTYNGVPFVQAGSHGKNIGHVQLAYNNGEVNVLASEYEGYGLMNKCKPDEKIQEVIDKYFDNKYLLDKDTIHGTITGSSYMNNTSGGNLLAKATADLLEKNNIEVDIVINNGIRDEVSTGDMTSEKIFNMIPFTNKTIVATNILGEDILNECVNYSNPYYKIDASLKIDSTAYYTIACIDYMLLHKNVNREYNYFPSFNENNIIYTIENYCNKIVEEYLKKNSTIDINNYYGSHFSSL